MKRRQDAYLVENKKPHLETTTITYQLSQRDGCEVYKFDDYHGDYNIKFDFIELPEHCVWVPQTGYHAIKKIATTVTINNILYNYYETYGDWLLFKDNLTDHKEELSNLARTEYVRIKSCDYQLDHQQVLKNNMELKTHIELWIRPTSDLIIDYDHIYPKLPLPGPKITLYKS